MGWLGYCWQLVRGSPEWAAHGIWGRKQRWCWARQLGLGSKFFLCLHWNSSTILVYVLKVVTADAMQQVKETQAVLGASTEKGQ